MRQTLDGAMDILSGRAPRDLSGEAALAAWQALFLLVPVVSTTFASVGRLFGRLGPGALGWLAVDEAGQGTPQNAVGALWRCRRAVVVGDPQQLEPITTIPFKVEQAVREHYGVEEEWLTGRTSVQGVADRLNRFGTTLPGAERLVWVGAPLAVHRRCDEPMFDLSNQIAYDGLMVDATDPALADKFAGDHPTLPQSKWIDVSSDASQGNWIPAEGEEVDRILAHLEEIGFDFGSVLAIGPFRDGARRLAERSRGYRGLMAGTIHTAQGKEADIVILVLGSDPAREGARAWAASSPTSSTSRSAARGAGCTWSATGMHGSGSGTSTCWPSGCRMTARAPNATLTTGASRYAMKSPIETRIRTFQRWLMLRPRPRRSPSHGGRRSPWLPRD